MFLHQQEHHNLGLTLSLGGGTGGGGAGGGGTGGGGGGGPSSSKATTTTTIATAVSIPFKFNMMMDYSSPSDVTFLRGIDVNRAARVEEEEEEVGVSSPNSTVSTVSGGKRGCTERDQSATTIVGPTDNGGTLSSRGIAMSDEEDDGSENSRKKLRLTKDQSAILENSFKEHNTLNPKQKLALAKRLGLRPRQVEVWFQNRRARTKLKQTEVDCEFLKRCCEQLTEENRRLQKEVSELRTLKLSPHFYMQMTPPTTLTMCPSCERVGAPPPGPPQPGPARHRGGVNPWGAAPVSVPIRPA